MLLLDLGPKSFSLAQSASGPDLVQLTREALARLDEASSSARRFTGFDLAHNQNRNDQGKLYSDTTNLFEDTWIADLPFKRLVEVGDQPLSGKALAKEQARYDQAVRDRLALDGAARARFVHEQSLDAGLDLPAITSPAYRLTRLRQETVDGRAATVIDAVPVSTAAIRYTLWISGDDPTLLRLTFETLADTPRMLRGSHGEKSFVVLEGTPLPAQTSVHALVPAGRQIITVDTEHTYSRYRRFTASTHMLSPSEPTSGP